MDINIDFSFRFVNYILDIFQVTLVALFLGCTLNICVAMLTIEIDLVRIIQFILLYWVVRQSVSLWHQSHYEDNLIVLLESLFYGFWALTLIFAVCECCQRYVNTFSDINDTFVQLRWYLYPIEIRRLLILMILNAQYPIDIAFFGSMTCCREQFRKVC